MADPDPSAERSWLAEQIAGHLVALRAARPLVQNITNYVSMDIVANALLAAGALPAMVHAREELDEFGGFIGALSINIGTLSADWVASMMAAAAGARERSKPWVLDPVGAGATRFRTETTLKLLAFGPAALRGNASEILAVASALGFAATASRGTGVDSGNSTDEAAGVAAELARHISGTVVVTGAVDIVTDGVRVLRFGNGSPLMAQVTAVGCSLSAIVAAYCAVADPFAAACAALAHVGIAGELAAEDARLPGSFRVALIDRLAALEARDILERLSLR